MSEISKQALKVDNNESFPNNSTGYITPSLLREYNENVIDSTVNQTVYTSDSSSWNQQITALETFTGSQQPSFTALNAFTASQLTVNTGVNSFTQSTSGRLTALESETANLEAFTSSINQIIVNGVSIGTSTRLFFSGFVSASIVPNVNGPIAAITILADQTFTPSASFNAYTASTAASQSVYSASVATSIGSVSSSLNAFTQSQTSWNNAATASITQLLDFSSSLDATFATDAQLNASSSVLQANIDTKLNTSSFNAYTQSIIAAGYATTSSFNAYTSSTNGRLNSIEVATSSLNTFSSSQLLLNPTFATTGSNTFVGTEIITGSLTITGSVYNNVISASIVSSTASLDFSIANFFTLTLPGASNTFINIQNVRPGQTALVEITNAGLAATASFSSNVFQPNASYYVPTNATASVDILTFSSFNASKVYLVSVKNMTNN
jgi:hypothetical protein